MLEHVRAQNLLRYVPSVVEHLVERELPALLRQAREALPAHDARAAVAEPRRGDHPSAAPPFALVSGTAGDPPHR